jgi:four helix bundle protein
MTTLDEQIAQWEPTVTQEIRSDVLWRSAAYRMATFAADWIWPDITRLASDARTVEIAQQLYRAVSDIGASYSEGYSRGSGRDRCRFFEYSLGSAREARDWTYKSRHIIGPGRTAELIALLTRIVQIVTVTITRERPREIRPQRTRRESST